MRCRRPPYLKRLLDVVGASLDLLALGRLMLYLAWQVRRDELYAPLRNVTQAYFAAR